MIGDRFMAAQMRKPSGWFGRLIISRLLNLGNAGINQLVLVALALAPDDRVLEVGFGGGDLITRILPALTAGRVCGVDFSKEMVDLASKRFAGAVQAGSLELHQADVEHLPLASDLFTKACTVNTVYFWEDPRAALHELNRVLVPSGRLVIGFSSRSVMEEMSVTQHGFKLYEPEDIQLLLEEAGFTVSEMVQGPKEPGESVCAVASKG